MLESLKMRGLRPSSDVIEVGCGSLRTGYWLIHFLDSGRYHAIEPAVDTLSLARQRFLEAGLEDDKQPRFSSDSDWDLGVFGVSPRFVLARGVWTQARGRDITDLLDSFADVAADDGLLLASYFPLPRRPRLRSSFRRMLRRPRRGVRRLTGYRGQSPKPRSRDVGSGSVDKPPREPWFGQRPSTVALDLGWIALECRRRGLTVRESRGDSFGGQTWLEIRRQH